MLHSVVEESIIYPKTDELERGPTAVEFLGRGTEILDKEDHLPGHKRRINASHFLLQSTFNQVLKSVCRNLFFPKQFQKQSPKLEMNMKGEWKKYISREIDFEAIVVRWSQFVYDFFGHHSFAASPRSNEKHRNVVCQQCFDQKRISDHVDRRHNNFMKRQAAIRDYACYIACLKTCHFTRLMIFYCKWMYPSLRKYKE